MGLLDLFNSDDGRLGIGLLAAAGPRADGAGFGQRLQEAMTGFQAQKDGDMKRKLSDLLLQKTGLELDAEKLKLTDAAKARQVLMGYGLPTDAPNRAGPAPGMGAGLPAEVMAGLPPELRTPVLSAMPNASRAAPAPPKSDFFSHYMGLADKYRQAGLPDQYASALATAEKFRPKYSTTPQQMVVSGKLTNVLLAEDGSAKTLDGFDVKPDMVQQDLGGVTQWLDKNALRPNQTFAKTQSPDNVATVGASIDNNKRTVGAAYDNANATRAVAAATRDAANIQAGFTAEQGLRKEFEGLPEVKNYKQAYPAYAAVVDSAARNTPQSDINLVYGIAKLYDPTSVVREGEYATVANSPNIPERIKGFAQYLAGGGRLSPETKRQIVAEAQGRIGTYETEAKKAKSSYETIAKKRGMDPGSVFADMGGMTANQPAAPDTPTARLLPALPPADSSNKGKRARDTETGKVYKSNGLTWVLE